jgi:signal transduction histidine kinase
MPNPSIRARLILLSVLLLAVFAVCCALLIRELARDSRTLVEEARLVSVVKSANSASKHFGDLKFWELEAAVTQLTSSQQKAAAAKAGLTSDLKAVSAVDPALVATIERDVDALTELARKAGVAYSSDDSAAGDALLAQAKEYVPGVDDRIDRIVDQVEQRALARRDAATREAELAVRLSIIGGLVALAAALGFTALTVRSITVPLGRLERSMVSIMHGELDVAVPPMGSHEIGAMAKTLGMLRDSLIDRDRMERERQRAEAEIRAARDTAEMALSELKATQANLLHAEKMASLGELTAGIAHEIKNPLNFVNNFANLSIELLSELKDATQPALAALDEPQRREVDDVIALLTGNLERIEEHGKRADNIVRSMLAHSRRDGGDRQSVDINALVEEALNLAYHGARAKDPHFNLSLERDYARDIAPIELVPQDMTRVFLNLFGNGFYGAIKRGREANDSAFIPVLTVATRDVGAGVEVRVRDNGIGVPAEIRDKLFQPFFTTKPTGEGTGLGLSISYEIVTKQHGGAITVESVVGEFAEFTVWLPRRAVARDAAQALGVGEAS